MFCSRVFATFDVEYNNSTVSFPDLPTDTLKNIFIVEVSERYNLFTSDEYFIYNSGNGSLMINNGVAKSSYLRDSNGLLYWNNWNSNTSGTRGISNINQILFSNFDIKDSSGNIVYFKNNKFDYEIFLSTEEETSEPVIAYTNWLDYENFSNYAVHIVLNPNTSESLNITDLPYEVDNENNLFRYYFEIEENGDYMFVFSFTYNDFNDIQTVTTTVSSISK